MTVLDPARLAELAAEYEARAEDPLPVYKELADKGLTGLPFDAAYGGGGRPYGEYLELVEELARSWAALAVGLGVHTLVCDAVQRFGSPALKDELLPRLLAGERLGAYALTEPASGSDAASLQTRAEPVDGGYAITGRKQFCTRGGEADHLLLMARTGAEGPRGISAFIVDRDSPGFRPVRTERKMAWRSSPTWELVFDHAAVPAGRRLGQEGDGFGIAMAALDAGRLGIAAVSVGLAQAALDVAVESTRTAVGAGSNAGSNAGPDDDPGQATLFLLADMAMAVEAGRGLYRHAAARKDAGLRYATEASMAKLACSDSAMAVTTDAVQILGPAATVDDHPAGRYLREAKALQIVEGTNQIQRMLIGRALAG